MALRVNIVLACATDGVISVLAATLLLLKFGNPYVAFAVTLAIPPLSCWLGGLRRPPAVAMIAVMAGIGWFFGTCFTSVVVVAGAARIERNASLPLAGYDQIVPCAACSAVMAVIWACVVALPENGGSSRIKNNGDA